MPKKVVILLVMVQLFVCLSCWNVRGAEVQPDELWLKAVQLASRNETLFAGKVHTVVKERIFCGQWRTTRETWLRTFETKPGSFQTAVVKRLVNGQSASELPEEPNSKVVNYNLRTSELTLPFKLGIQRKLDRSFVRFTTKNGQNCAVYHFNYTTAIGENIVGKAWLSRTGIPVALHYSFKSIPKSLSHQIRSVAHEVHYQYHNDGRWYPDQVLVRLKLRDDRSIVSTSSCFKFNFSDYQNPKAIEIENGGKRLGNHQANYAVPFDYINNLLYAKVRLNDSETDYRFLVDTGFGVTALNTRTAAALGLKKLTEIGLSDGYQSQKTDLVVIEKIKLGELAVEKCGAIILDLANLEQVGMPVDGIIGSNFLKLFTVRIDYAKQVLIFSGNTDPFRVELDESHRIPLIQGATGIIMTPFAVAGAKTLFLAEIDTGCNGSLSVPGAFREEFKPGLNCPLVKSQGTVTKGVLGESEGQISRIGEFTIGDLRIKNALVHFTRSILEFLLVGNRLLSQFTVVIEYPRDTLYLVPLENQMFETNERSHGFAMEQNAKGKLVVIGIWEGSAADRGGLRVGDVILRAAVNGQSGTTFKTVEKVMADNDTINLLVQREDRTIEIALTKELLLPEVEF